ncbi:hypothetical protein JCM8547_006647 [Rhodosporidiobolus lusitaniae]
MSLYTTVGPVLVSTCLSCWSCGIVLSLAGRYVGKFSRDRTWIRIAVAIGTLWAMLDTAINCSWAYKWSVTYFMNPADLALMPWELTAYCVVMSSGVLGVQLFYLYRLYAVSGGNYILVGILAVMSLACYGIGVYMCAYCWQHPDSIGAFADIADVSWGWFSGVLFIDLVITGSMSWYLIFKPKRQTKGAVQASSPIKMVVMKAVQTNALSAICQLCIVGLYARYPTALYYTYFGLIETKVYIGSFIATLNARSAHAEGAFDTTASAGDGRTKGFGAASRPNPVQVDVRQEIAIDADEDVDSLDNKPFPTKGGMAATTPYRVQFDNTPGEMEKGGKRGMGGHEMDAF